MVFSGLSAAMVSITGTSTDKVYSVGADPGDGKGPYVLHYDGQAWERLETGASGDLWWISQSQIDGAYFMAGANGMILSFDPDTNQFTQFTNPGDGTVFGVWGADGTHVWAAGGDLDHPDSGGFVWRYDGNDWTIEDVSAAVSDAFPTLYKVWGRAADDVYVVGRLGLALHFDGVAWSQIPTDTTSTLFTVHGDDTRIIAVGGFGNAAIEELEEGSFVNHAGQNLPQMNGVFVPSAGAPTAVGNDGAIARRTDEGWMLLTTNFSTPLDFHGTWVDPDGGVWAVGGDLSAALDDGMIAYIGSAHISDTVR